MSHGPNDLTGSAARSHEETGGNVTAGRLNLPAGGDAARKAEEEGDRINEAHGVRTAPRGEYRSAMSLNLPRVVGARLSEEPKPAADLSQRKASDYLPPHLKAQLIAEGRLDADGNPAPAGAKGGANRGIETEKARVEETPAPAPGALKRLAGFLAKLFGKG